MDFRFKTVVARASGTHTRLICRFASRFIKVREVLVRSLVLYYIAAQVLVNTPQALLPSKTPTQTMHHLGWLVRYSNTSPLLTSSFGFMVSYPFCIDTMACCSHRYMHVREGLLRLFAALYLGKTALIVFPEMCQAASFAQLHSWAWLLRYSSTWPLAMTAVGLMVCMFSLPSCPRGQLPCPRDPLPCPCDPLPCPTIPHSALYVQHFATLPCSSCSCLFRSALALVSLARSCPVPLCPALQCPALLCCPLLSPVSPCCALLSPVLPCCRLLCSARLCIPLFCPALLCSAFPYSARLSLVVALPSLISL